MDRPLEKKIRKLGPTPLRVLSHVLQHSSPASLATSAGTISALKMDVNSVGGGYSVLSRNDLVMPAGRDASGTIRWEPSSQVSEDKDEVLELIRRLGAK